MQVYRGKTNIKRDYYASSKTFTAPRNNNVNVTNIILMHYKIVV